MRVRRDYDGWLPADPLDPPAESVLVFLEGLAAGGRLREVGEVVARIDEYGMVSAEIPLGRAGELYLQTGDGWDRVLWTCPSGRTHEWTWREDETPGDLNALLEGRGVDRTTTLGRRSIAVRLFVQDRTLAAEGTVRRAVLLRLGMELSDHDEPAL